LVWVVGGDTSSRESSTAASFGVRSDQFRPLAPNRGLPPDASQPVRAALQDAPEDTCWGQTWILWHELLTQDLDEAGQGLVLHDRYQGPQGDWIEISREIDDDPLVEGKRWQEDGHTYWIGRLRRRDVLAEPNWVRLMKIMELLAERFGDRYVRMVVWFD
jgi:hypothetical protein